MKVIEVLINMGELKCLLCDGRYQIVCDCYLKVSHVTVLFPWGWESLTGCVVAHPISISLFPWFLMWQVEVDLCKLSQNLPFDLEKKLYVYVNVDYESNDVMWCIFKSWAYVS